MITFSQSFNLLQDAYKNKSDEELIRFLDNWNESIQPNENSVFTDLRKDVYEIYKIFYDPFESSGGNNDSLCFIIQNEVGIFVLNKDTFDLSFSTSDLLTIDEITDFRPEINNHQVHTLYLTQEYEKTLNKFLDIKDREPQGGIRIAKERTEKLQFLNRFLFIGYWGTFLHFETNPYVDLFVFNKNRDLAKIEYKLDHEGREAIFKKIEGNWQFVSDELQWIE